MTFEETLEKNGKLVYTNVGVSMNPLIRENRDVMVIETIQSPLKKYDAVFFKRPGIKGRGEYVLHRIIKVYDHNNYYIIGDNCLSGEMVNEDQILGILTHIQRDHKMINVTDLNYQLFVRIWYIIYPLRVLYHKLYYAGHIIKRKVLKIK